jgi:hypothetical protein
MIGAQAMFGVVGLREIQERLAEHGVGLAGSKLAIRLSRQHPVVESFHRARLAINSFIEVIATSDARSAVDQRNACVEASEAVTSAEVDFAARAYELAGTPLAAAQLGSAGKDGS